MLPCVPTAICLCLFPSAEGTMTAFWGGGVEGGVCTVGWGGRGGVPCSWLGLDGGWWGYVGQRRVIMELSAISLQRLDHVGLE